MESLKTYYQKAVDYPAAPQSLEQAAKRDYYGLAGAFAGAAAGLVLLGGVGAVVCAPVGVKVGHWLAAQKM